ncbi:nucleoside triphosphate pyrophosphohydrolase family protein [Rhizobium herbae]|uniref:NTP pyrophosphatase (Non-canonical NTP hydrolase) n=1 Tax=Rhizobium herbae TaxID=508661 RepID=A0ABS4EUL0_9HYPH|nr:MazG nucleotide pyrophosphohydrolase domain-containing protein [Rhizobium herbae]MBP1861638.1 NTP pyrophosphatase (non-canonical NTP hydrolase) [Rhizobium herbae]
MQLSEIIERQIAADSRRGFPTSFESDSDRHDQLMRDLVGLVGEVGEFADLLKKVGLVFSNPDYKGPSLADAEPQLRSELADVAIYLFRLSVILKGDLENDILKKMKTNDLRYQYLEK